MARSSVSCIPSHRLISTVFLFVMAIAASASAAENSADKTNFASKAELPSGIGLAGQYRGDAVIKADKDVIFADNFESGHIGEGWDDISNKNGNVLSFASPDADAKAGLGQRCLRVEAHLDQDTGGGMTKWFESADTLFVRFYTKFDPSCDYVHHFVTLRANKGLRGKDMWSGFGGAGLKPDGNTRFSTSIEPTGNWGRWPAPGRWNSYSYWHEMVASPDKKYWGNAFIVPESPVIPKGRWICVELMIKHNTPGRPDGEQAYWIDGVLTGHWKGINWRTSPTLFANALTLESYITTLWTKNPVNVVSFDNLVIARRYIGPSGAQ